MAKTNQTNHIMVVEDELIVAKHIKNHLEKSGYHVAALVSTGEEAVKQAEEIQPDLILMDIRLAGQMDGIKAAEKIRARFNIPIIYLTAYADQETLARSRITEPFGYLVKPFEAKALHSSIEIALYRHRMEKKLKESEARFRTLAESAPVGIFQADVNGRCIYLNKKACEITGLTLEESRGQGWAGRLHPDDRERVYSQWHQMVHSGGTFALEYRFRTPEDRVTWVFGQAAALEDEAGNKIGYIGTLSDITDRKQLEEKLLTAQKLESLGILAGGIAHDFNNLLSVIMGNISMVKEEIPPHESHYALLGSAEKASFEAAGLAQKLITFSKGGWLMRKPVSLQEILRMAIGNTLAHTDIFWEMDIPSDLLLLYGDEKQLQQVFCNLIRNAAEAVWNKHENEKNGKITLQARNRQLEDDQYQELKPGKYVSITIEDNGAGIQQEHLGRVFDPYFSTKNLGPQKGMGLGLAICYSIVTKHGGAIKIESEYGKGTVAELYLPAFSEEAGVSAEGKEQEAAHSGEKRIILMDDDQNILDMTAQMLKKIGYHVETFTEGGTALQAYKKAKEEQQPFAAVLLDIVIKKGMEGKETLKKLLEFDPNARVMAMSGYVDDSDVADLKKEGFLEVLLKPFRRKELEQALDKVLIE